MGHPVPRLATSGAELVSAYVAYIGEEEAASQRSPIKSRSNSSRGSAYLLGQGCLELIAGNDRLANGVFRYVRDILAPFTLQPSRRFNTQGSRAAHLFHLAVLLLARDQYGAVQAFHKATHAETVRDLRHMQSQVERTQDAGHIGELNGGLAEQGEMGLLTRPGAGTLAVRSLIHHDQSSDGPSNYDIMIVHADAHDISPTVQKVQSKRACLGFCGNTRGQWYGRTQRDKYNDDIVLLSEHCDLGREPGDYGSIRAGIILEAQGRTSLQTTAMLNMQQNRLITALTDPQEWRMGRIPSTESTDMGLAA